MLRLLRLASLVFVCAVVTACSYKSEIRQGREQVLESIKDVKPGMRKSEVAALLGGGRIKPFSDDVWLYVFRLREAGFLGTVYLLSVELKFDESGVLTTVNIVRNDFEEDGGDAQGGGG